MKANLIKALAIAATLLVTPAFAEEATENTVFHEKIDGKEIKIAVFTSEDESSKTMKIVRSVGSEEEQQSADVADVAEPEMEPETEKKQTSIRFKSSDDGVVAIKKVIKTLSNTEWDDLNDQEEQELLATLEEINDGMEVEISHDIDMDSDGDSSAEGIIAIIAVFGMPLFIIIAILYYKHRKRMVKVALIKDYLDAGKDVPDEVLVAINGSEIDPPADSFQGGVRNIAVGAGLFLFLGLIANWGVAALALIPLFIGIGKLVVWRMNSGTIENSSQNQAD